MVATTVFNRLFFFRMCMCNLCRVGGWEGCELVRCSLSATIVVKIIPTGCLLPIQMQHGVGGQSVGVAELSLSDGMPPGIAEH